EWRRVFPPWRVLGFLPPAPSRPRSACLAKASACPRLWLANACAALQVPDRSTESHVPNHACRITWRHHAKLQPRASSCKSMVRTLWGVRFETTGRLSAVGSADADPGVALLLIVDLRIVDHHIETQPLHRQSADGGKQGIGSH